MANDEESIYKAVRAAASSTRRRLGQARAQVAAAGSAFKGGVGFGSWGSVGQMLSKSKAVAARYEELQTAIRAAESAIAKAESACDALTRAAQN